MNRQDYRSLLSPAEILDILVRKRRTWMLTPIVLGALAVVIALVLPPGYRSSASFVPETSGPSGGALDALGQQAAAFGFDIGVGLEGEGPLYLDLLRSREVRERVVVAQYALPDRSQTGTLVDYYGLDNVRPAEKAREKARERLGEGSRAAYDPASTIVSLSVITRHREMSQAIVAQYLLELERFNVEKRARHIRDQVEFLQRQLERAKENLRQTEDSLQIFLERNRLYESSPALVFQRTRLDRQVIISTGIVSRLQQQLEQAQLDLLRETPSVSVIDQPNLPQRRVRPRRRMIVVTASLAGLVLGLLLALGAEGAGRMYRELPPHSREEIGAMASQAARFRGRLAAVWARRGGVSSS